PVLEESLGSSHQRLRRGSEDVHVVVGGLVELRVSSDGGSTPGDVHREAADHLLDGRDRSSRFELVALCGHDQSIRSNEFSSNSSSCSALASYSASRAATASAGVSVSPSSSSSLSRRATSFSRCSWSLSSCSSSFWMR